MVVESVLVYLFLKIEMCKLRFCACPEFVELPKLITMLPVDVFLVLEPNKELLVIVDEGGLFVTDLSCDDLCVCADSSVTVD